MRKVTISKAANYLGHSPETLRRWDRKEKLVAHRKENNYRYYYLSELEEFSKELNLFKLAEHWATNKQPYKPLPCYFCRDRFIFKARFTKFQKVIENKFSTSFASIVASITGEIGDNSFDHNIGNWTDTTGIFFGYNLEKNKIALADRGQGILKTLKRVKPELQNHKQALKVAFTEVISGRYPEHRGNGLKFVKERIEENKRIKLFFKTGNAKTTLKKGKNFKVEHSDTFLKGCLVKIKIKK